jgi:hypothetical protein
MKLGGKSLPWIGTVTRSLSWSNAEASMATALVMDVKAALQEGCNNLLRLQGRDAQRHYGRATG